MRFAVFISGNGSNLQAIIDACKAGQIDSKLALVFSNRRKAYGLKRAEEAGITVLHLDPRMYTNKQSYDRDIVIHLKLHKIDFIVLAGFMRILTPFFIKEFPYKILNVHPSLLPAFKGAQAIKDAYTYGAKVTGVTIHFVDEKMDHGPIILQEALPIVQGEPFEKLEERVHAIEHHLCPKAIRLFEQNKIRRRGRKITILD